MDPTCVPRAEVNQFEEALDAMIECCSSKNIQLCKDWILKYIVPSSGRITAIGKYLVAVSESLNRSGEPDTAPTSKNGPPARRKQLHLLYLLNDTLHHAKHHSDSSAAADTLAKDLWPYALSLVKLAFANKVAPHTQHRKRVLGLLDTWAEADYFEASYIQRLRDVASEAIEEDGLAAKEPTVTHLAPYDTAGQDRKDDPYIMPDSHGDPSTLFYDLPASNMIPHITPNSRIPISTELIKPLEFGGGPADQDLAFAVKGFLDDINLSDRIEFGEVNQDNVDVDELGQYVIRDPSTTEIIKAEGYYGWSGEYCQKKHALGKAARSPGGSKQKSNALTANRPLSGALQKPPKQVELILPTPSARCQRDICPGRRDHGDTVATSESATSKPGALWATAAASSANDARAIST
ncbi:MAG: hypothetical protein Q9163_001909 [Psora crenata]